MQEEVPISSLVSEGDDVIHHHGEGRSAQHAHKVGCRSAGVPRPQDGVMFPSQPHSAFVEVEITPSVFVNPRMLACLKSAIAAVPVYEQPPYTSACDDCESILAHAGRISQQLATNDFAVVFAVATERFSDFIDTQPPEDMTHFERRVSADGKYVFPKTGGDIFFHIKAGIDAQKAGAIKDIVDYIALKLKDFATSIYVRDGFNSTDPITKGRNQFGFFDAGINPAVTCNPVFPNGPNVQAYPPQDRLDLSKIPESVRAEYTPGELFASLNNKEAAAKCARENRVDQVNVGAYSTSFIEEGPHIGGSFIIWQEWHHTGLDKFNAMSVEEQETVFGRKKSDGAFIETKTPPLSGGINRDYPRCHIVRTHIRMTDMVNETADVDPLVQNTPGASLAPLQINRQAASFIDEKGGKGLGFLAYAKSTVRFDQILDRMIGKNVTWPVPRDDHSVDALLDFSEATRGAYFYVPSETEIGRMVQDEPRAHYDIAVVGGGASGAFCALQLKTKYPHLHIALFERGDSLGGRLVSVRPPEAKGVVCELGGMRIPHTQPYVNKLVNSLGLERMDFPVDSDKNPAFVRGTLLTNAQLKDPAEVRRLYNLGPSVTNDDIEDFLKGAVRRLGFPIPRNATEAKALREELMNTKIDLNGNRSESETATWLFDNSIHMLIQKMFGQEAFEYQKAISGYYSPWGDWNAVDALIDTLSEFGNASYTRLKDGYRSLVTTMGDKFSERGGESYFNRELSSIIYDDNGFLLKFKNSGNITTKKLILAMPSASLRGIKSTLLEQPKVEKMILSVAPRPFLKMFLVYDEVWWEKSLTGRSVTDMPIRQAYYWQVDPDNGRAVVMIYDDGIHAEAWASLTFRTLWKIGKVQGSWDDVWNIGQKWGSNKAPPVMVEEAHREFAKFHNADPMKVPQPIDAAYAAWTQDTVFGGGVNFWLPGVKSQNVIKKIMNPIEGVPLFICGSAFSNSQGWVEGAIETADTMLDKYFSVPSILADDTL